MNAFLFDEIDWKVKASKFRAEDFRNQYDSETEILGRQEKETQDDAAGPDEDAAATEKDEDDAFLNAGTEDPDEGTPLSFTYRECIFMFNQLKRVQL